MYPNSGNADRHRTGLLATVTSSSQPSRDEAIRLMRSGLAKAMRDVAASYVMPICWITARDHKPFILDSGSAFLLDCGAGPFLVTANHVYQGFRTARETHPDAVCIAGDLRFDLTGRYRCLNQPINCPNPKSRTGAQRQR
jgi:hypothetical protein